MHAWRWRLAHWFGLIWDKLARESLIKRIMSPQEMREKQQRARATRSTSPTLVPLNHACLDCSYNRTGLAADAPCPECGCPPLTDAQHAKREAHRRFAQRSKGWLWGVLLIALVSLAVAALLNVISIR